MRSNATAKALSSPFSANGSPTASLGEPPSARGTTAWRSVSTAILRSAPRRTARKPGRMQARSRMASRSARRPIHFPSKGRTGAFRRPIRVAGAREGWTSLSAVYRANMRHAGMLRIDHAMGLQRLFLIPDGARPADGAYLSYPLDDLIGHIALESERAQCMVIGEDLGTVPEGFRDRLTRAKITGMRVLWFERKGVEFVSPASYPPTSVACVATHDLATLAGWWQGADIAERLALGLLSLGEGRRGDRRAARGEARASARARRGRLHCLADGGRAASRRHGGSRSRADRRFSVDVRSRPVRRPCRRDGRDQLAGHRSRAPQLAPQGRPGRRRRLRQPSGAVDPRGAGQGADIARRKRFGASSARRVLTELGLGFTSSPDSRPRVSGNGYWECRAET